MLTSLTEHSDVIIYLLISITGLFVASISWFTTNTLKKINDNQTKLFEMINEVTKELATLRGEHKVYHKE